MSRQQGHPVSTRLASGLRVLPSGRQRACFLHSETSEKIVVKQNYNIFWLLCRYIHKLNL